MRIVIIINLFPPKWIGGAEIATYNLAEKLSKRGHEIHIVTSYDREMPFFCKINGFYVHRIDYTRVRVIGDLLFRLKICFVIWKIKPDIVHVQSISIISALITKKILNIPYVVWGRGSDVYHTGCLTNITSKLLIENANAVIALTADMRKRMMEIFCREIFIVPNGIDIVQLNEKNFKYLRGKDEMSIIFIGRLNPVKGISYLLYAMKLVIERIPEAKLLLIGDGEEKEKLEQLSIQLGIRESVQFIGKIPHEEVQTYLHQADIFVLPSLSEGFPNVILEAMVSGLPIVATRVGGIPDIIQNNRNGFLVESEDADDLAKKILILLTDIPLREKISAYNIHSVKKYSWDNILSKLENIYELSIQ